MCDEKETMEAVNNFFEQYDYLLDPHTAVAVAVNNSYVCDTQDETPTVVVSTASPYKFPTAVYEAIAGKKIDDPFKAAKKLNFDTGEPIPESISELKEKEIRFDEVKEKDELFDAVMSFVEQRK